MQAEPPDAAPARYRDDGKMLLDQRFDAGTLHIRRAAALEFAAGTGMPPGRAADVMIVVHELAANTVRHGAGTGRLRMWTTARALCCQVDDAGSREPGRDGEQEIAAAGAAQASAWPVQPGHGLWLIQELADQMNVTAGPGGSQVTAVFTLHAR